MVVKNFRMIVMVCTLALGVGCAGSPVRDCFDNSEGVARIGCVGPLIPVINAVLPVVEDDSSE